MKQNRRGAPPSPRALASRRAAETRRLRAGRITGPFAGFRFKDRAELLQTMGRWRALVPQPTKGRKRNGPPTRPMRMISPERWYVVVIGKDASGMPKTAGVFFSGAFPTSSEITKRLEDEYEDDPRYPTSWDRVLGIGYRVGV